MTTNQVEYLSKQLDKVRAAAESARSHWSQQWLSQLEQRLLRQIQWAMLEQKG